MEPWHWKNLTDVSSTRQGTIVEAGHMHFHHPRCFHEGVCCGIWMDRDHQQVCGDEVA